MVLLKPASNIANDGNYGKGIRNEGSIASLSLQWLRLQVMINFSLIVSERAVPSP